MMMEGDDEETRSTPEGLGGEELMAVLDFDMLCATVALQTQGINTGPNNNNNAEDDEGPELGGGVQRLWEGNIFDCLADRRIAIETACCPCYRFGKNMRRANLGPCFLQGSIYLFLAIVVLFNFIAFGITKKLWFLYAGVVSAIVIGIYVGYFRTRIRKQFNVKESRTLEMNNVQDGVWHGRGDTICIGSFGEGSKTLIALHKPSSIPTTSPGLCSMARLSNGSSNHSWNSEANHSEPLVP